MCAGSSRRSSITVHLMVLNGATVVARALDPVLPHVTEVCYVDTGSTDGTPYVIQSVCRRAGVQARGVQITPETHPELYFEDDARSWVRDVPGPHTRSPLLRDWSAARNLGLGTVTGEYVLKLDADDEVLDPDELPRVVEYMELFEDVDVVVAPYEVMDGAGAPLYNTVASRLWRNLPAIRFKGACHENVDWWRDHKNWMMAGGLKVRDWRDSLAERVPLRYYKVLLREFERVETSGELHDGQLLMYLASEALQVDPDFAGAILERVGRLPNPTDEAWRLGMLGESLRAAGRHPEADDAQSRAAMCGNARAMLQLAVRAASCGHSGWKFKVDEALRRNRCRPYPLGATVEEIRSAAELLKPKSGGEDPYR